MHAGGEYDRPHTREEKLEPTILRIVAQKEGQCLLKWKLDSYFRGWYWNFDTKKTEKNICACGQTLSVDHFLECLNHRNAKLDLEFQLGVSLDNFLEKVRKVDLKKRWDEKLAALAA